MGVFVRAVITGFGFSLGKALFDRFSERLGLQQDKEPTPPPSVVTVSSDSDSDHDHDGYTGATRPPRPWR